MFARVRPHPRHKQTYTRDPMGKRPHPARNYRRGRGAGALSEAIRVCSWIAEGGLGGCIQRREDRRGRAPGRHHHWSICCKTAARWHSLLVRLGKGLHYCSSATTRRHRGRHWCSGMPPDEADHAEYRVGNRDDIHSRSDRNWFAPGHATIRGFYHIGAIEGGRPGGAIPEDVNSPIVANDRARALTIEHVARDICGVLKV